MGKYRKKPVVIEAFRFGSDEPPSWFATASEKRVTLHNDEQYGGPGYALIETLEGTHRANFGDWIIRGVKGELYPCKPDIFDATYEVA